MPKQRSYLFKIEITNPRDRPGWWTVTARDKSGEIVYSFTKYDLMSAVNHLLQNYVPTKGENS